MNLTKIEAYGFKSFADKFEMKFEKPVTAIVGPNGCGKSNVSDAVRWVLGEQSAKLLRGKTMQDLIFSGTEKRKSMSYCEVSLFFDNKNRLFPLEMDEVIISRKLYRSGESEYLINKNPTRLKVISDLLREVGLGREGYSIVGQGRMDAILNSKPDERRAIFEEALGISKFRIRKNETERKLEKYRDNMSRLNDIMKELENQLIPLKKQSEVARKFLEINSQLKKYEVNAYIYHYDNASAKRQNIRLRIDALTEEQNQAELKQEEANQYYQSVFEKMANTDEEILLLHNEEVNLTAAVERQSGENKVLSERIKYFQKTVEDAVAAIEYDTKSIADTEKMIQQLTDSLADKQQNHLDLSQRLNKLNLQHAEAEKKLNSIRDDADEKQSFRLKMLDNLTDKKTALASYTTEKITINERLTNLNKREAEISKKLTENSEEEKSFISAFNTAKADAENAKQALDNATEENKKNEQKLFEANNIVNSANQNAAVLSARQKYLLAASQNYEGFAESVKRLMLDAANDVALKEKALGVVANIIKVEEKYETAIEAALGGSLNNVVTKNEEDAKYLINHLKRNRYGRVTFMPLTSIKPRTLNDNSVLREKGCLGVAEKVVKTDNIFLPVVKSLLGATVIADTLDSAVAISKKYNYAYRIVTLEGEIILPAGTISGGTKRIEGASLLGYERELSEIKEKIILAEKEKYKAIKTRNELSTNKQSLSLMLIKLNEEYHSAIVNVAKNQEIISKFCALSENELNQFNSITAEQQTLKNRLTEINAKFEQMQKEIEELNNKKTEINTQSDDVQKEYSALKQQRNSLFDEINEVKLKIGLIVNNIATDTKEQSALQDNLTSLRFDLQQKREQKNTAQLNIEDLEKKLFSSSADSANITALNDIRKNTLDMSAKKDSLKAECTKADYARSAANSEVNRIYETKLKAENELSNIDINLEALQKRMDEVYEVTYSQALLLKEDNFDYKKAEGEISRLKNAVSRLGYVNPSSIEGYEQTKARYDDMDAQMQDLSNAEQDQVKIVNDLTNEMVTRFNSGFELINRNFGEIFKELFAGGHARLTIEEEEGKSPLDFGIEIEAQPPGKRLQNINLLSGGERTLTAVAILFAIIKLRPMPFCVLDEIEAALDDANAERIAQYIRRFSENTQFVIITHKKPTMESADVLYGITMEEKGVSKNVSVQLSDAIVHSA